MSQRRGERRELAARPQRGRRHRAHAVGQARRVRRQGAPAAGRRSHHQRVRGRRHLRQGHRRLQLVRQLDRARRALRRVRRRPPPLQQPDVGRRRWPDGRRVPERGDGRRHRSGELRRGAQGHDDGRQQPLRPGVRADGAALAGDPRRDGVLGAVRTAVTGADVRVARRAATWRSTAPRSTTTPKWRSTPGSWPRTIPRRGSASRSRSRIITRAR